MPIQVLKDDERLTYENSGSKIFYKRISSLRRSAIVKKHTKRGREDWGPITAHILSEVILGWENVMAGTDAVPFSVEMIASLPDDVTADIIELCGGADPDGGAEKNLGTSSDGS